MSESSMHIKLGDREFEATGTEAWVERQLQAFRQLIAPTVVPPAPPAISLEKILRTQGRVVSLGVTAKPDDAVLALLLGYHRIHKSDFVSGTDIMKGLRDSGLRIQRADNILSKHVRNGYVITVGRHRRRRYKLSAEGMERGRQIAEQLNLQRTPPEK